jgi:hypothetical protein
MVCFSVLIGKNEVIKISDFGTSRQWSEHSTKMSFAGKKLPCVADPDPGSGAFYYLDPG